MSALHFGRNDDQGPIIRNLLDTAIKYTLAGGKVTMEHCKTTQPGAPDTAWLQITVSDSGIGIPESDKPHIFDRFFRVDKARSRQKSNHLSSSSGAGLGLSIVQQIVTLYSGRIEVESQLNEGTTFSIELPCR